jgi:hypothetical protein
MKAVLSFETPRFDDVMTQRLIPEWVDLRFVESDGGWRASNSSALHSFALLILIC